MTWFLLDLAQVTSRNYILATRYAQGPLAWETGLESSLGFCKQTLFGCMSPRLPPPAHKTKETEKTVFVHKNTVYLGRCYFVRGFDTGKFVSSTTENNSRKINFFYFQNITLSQSMIANYYFRLLPNISFILKNCFGLLWQPRRRTL